MFNNKGFTLMEIVIVIALIAILTAISIPLIQPMLASQRITSSANNVRSALQIAKTEAIKNQTTATVTFVQGIGNAGTYTATLQNGTNLGNASGDMGTGVELYGVAFAGANPAEVTFNAMGLAPDTFGEVRFRDVSRTLFKRVTVAISGNITITKSTDGVTFVE